MGETDHLGDKIWEFGVVSRHHTRFGVLVGMARDHIAPSSLNGGWAYPENLVWSGKGLHKTRLKTFTSLMHTYI